MGGLCLHADMCFQTVAIKVSGGSFPMHVLAIGRGQACVTGGVHLCAHKCGWPASLILLLLLLLIGSLALLCRCVPSEEGRHPQCTMCPMWPISWACLSSQTEASKTRDTLSKRSRWAPPPSCAALSLQGPMKRLVRPHTPASLCNSSAYLEIFYVVGIAILTVVVVVVVGINTIFF